MKSLSILVEMSKSCFFPVSLFQQSNNNTSNVFSSLTLSEIQAWSESFERLMASLGESIISEHFWTLVHHLWILERFSSQNKPTILTLEAHDTCDVWKTVISSPGAFNSENLEVQSFQEVAEYFESSYGVNTVRRTFSFGWLVRTWRRRRALRRWRRRHGWSTKTTFQFCHPERWAAVLQKLLQLHGTVEENWVRSFGNDKLSETSSRLSNVHAKITIINIFLWMPLNKQCLSNAVKINIKNDNHFSIKY